MSTCKVRVGLCLPTAVAVHSPQPAHKYFYLKATCGRKRFGCFPAAQRHRLTRGTLRQRHRQPSYFRRSLLPPSPATQCVVRLHASARCHRWTCPIGRPRAGHWQSMLLCGDGAATTAHHWPPSFRRALASAGAGAASTCRGSETPSRETPECLGASATPRLGAGGGGKCVWGGPPPHPETAATAVHDSAAVSPGCATAAPAAAAAATSGAFARRFGRRARARAPRGAERAPRRAAALAYHHAAPVRPVRPRPHAQPTRAPPRAAHRRRRPRRARGRLRYRPSTPRLCGRTTRSACTPPAGGGWRLDATRGCRPPTTHARRLSFVTTTPATIPVITHRRECVRRASRDPRGPAAAVVTPAAPRRVVPHPGGTTVEDPAPRRASRRRRGSPGGSGRHQPTTRRLPRPSPPPSPLVGVWLAGGGQRPRPPPPPPPCSQFGSGWRRWTPPGPLPPPPLPCRALAVLAVLGGFPKWLPPHVTTTRGGVGPRGTKETWTAATRAAPPRLLLPLPPRRAAEGLRSGVGAPPRPPSALLTADDQRRRHRGRRHRRHPDRPPLPVARVPRPAAGRGVPRGGRWQQSCTSTITIITTTTTTA